MIGHHVPGNEQHDHRQDPRTVVQTHREPDPQMEQAHGRHEEPRGHRFPQREREPQFDQKGHRGHSLRRQWMAGQEQGELDRVRAGVAACEQDPAEIATEEPGGAGQQELVEPGEEVGSGDRQHRRPKGPTVSTGRRRTRPGSSHGVHRPGVRGWSEQQRHHCQQGERVVVHRLAHARPHAVQEKSAQPCHRHRQPSERSASAQHARGDGDDLNGERDTLHRHCREQVHEGDGPEQCARLPRQLEVHRPAQPGGQQQAEADPRRRQTSGVARPEDPAFQPAEWTERSVIRTHI